MSRLARSRDYDDQYDQDRRDASPKNAGNGLTGTRWGGDVEAPEARIELGVGNDGEHECMAGEDEIVRPHRRLRGARVSRGVLSADEGRVEEARTRDGVAGEAQDVDGGVVDRGACR